MNTTTTTTATTTTKKIVRDLLQEAKERLIALEFVAGSSPNVEKALLSIRQSILDLTDIQ